MLIRPMLATLGRLPTGGGWASEFKWDGVRAICYADGSGMRVVSRNDLDMSAQYPELTGVRADAVFDGEIVALDEAMVPGFARLQNRMHVKAPSAALLRSTPVTLYLFDLLELAGQLLLARPYRERRERLEALGLDSGVVRTPPSFPDAAPPDVYRAAVDNGLEGVVCKRSGSTYQPGRRSPDWVKVPVALTQEVVVVGWLPGAGRRDGLIGSLLLAVTDDDGLVYAGKVGTGFTDDALRALATRLGPLERKTPPLPDVPRPDARDARWVTPSLVGEVAFRNWTPDRRLRHPSWRGLRPDKSPAEARAVIPPGG